MKTTQRAFEHLVDYAGLFPPAQLSMAEVVTRYDLYRRGPDHRWLGRLIVPVKRLAEMTACVESAALNAGGGSWELSLLSSGDPVEDDVALRSLHERFGSWMRVVSLEVKGIDVADPKEWRMRFPELDIYVELPLDDQLEANLSRLSAAEFNAKVRTGGVEPDAFPTAGQLARFVDACAAAGVGFKATAGLHHPLRASRTITPSDSRVVEMHGFVNLLVVSAVRLAGPTPVDVLTQILDQRDAGQFHWESNELVYGGSLRVSGDDFAQARNTAFHSFGSCSFEEPLDDLQTLQLIRHEPTDVR